MSRAFEGRRLPETARSSSLGSETHNKMKLSNLGRYSLCSSVAAALLVACGRSQPPIGGPSAMPQSPAMAQRFQHPTLSLARGTSTDGTFPTRRLVPINGKLYGTTLYGGAYCPSRSRGGCGTVFSITTRGTETVLHSFGNGSDGVYPSSMTFVGDGLYGTTEFGGAHGNGVVFSITTSGEEHVLHSFGKPPDGNDPAGLTNIHGKGLYGTTLYGGAYGMGTVFSVTTNGVEKVVHSFGEGCKNGYCESGSKPYGRLLEVGSRLYGTTLNGGAANDGIVFSMSTAGQTKVLYSFSNYGPSGESVGANGGLVDLGGVLYGTTSWGSGYYDDGTVFSVTTNGTGKVLHNFDAGCGKRVDGAHPAASLIDVNGTFYGTTSAGGKYGSSYYCDGSGTVYSVTPSGRVKVLYSFGSTSGDGTSPLGELTRLNGILYGTTYYGGACGDGTVFSITLSGTEKVLHSFC
ncbi:MAG TPA: choice-of-anchor tandem repeat GloVer-containing protein [Candidatus Cybelea sp.]